MFSTEFGDNNSSIANDSLTTLRKIMQHRRRDNKQSCGGLRPIQLARRHVIVHFSKGVVMQGQQVETLVKEIQTMDRGGLIHLLRSMQCDFEIDFTDEFLDSISIERLRHIALAGSLHNHRKSDSPTVT
jgi:hypothetical protein